MEKLWVKTGARLHLGQLDLNGSLNRLYGGLGLALNWPRIELVAQKHDGLCLMCPGEAERLEKIARKYLEHYSLPGVKLELKQSFPSHAGFGSGTQLALAFGRAITNLYGLTPSPVELVRVAERENSRSGVGIAAFFQGGFLVDGGSALNGAEKTDKKAPPIIARLPFPEDWSVILAVPERYEKIFGKREIEAFSTLPPMDEQLSGRICRLLLMKLLPGLAEENLSLFGQGLSQIQACVGDYFAAVQGGRFACLQSERMAEYFSSIGLVGVGQSSWGPAVYGFCKKENLEKLLEQVRLKADADVLVGAAGGNNHGASWGWTEDET